MLDEAPRTTRSTAFSLIAAVAFALFLLLYLGLAMHLASLQHPAGSPPLGRWIVSTLLWLTPYTTLLAAVAHLLTRAAWRDILLLLGVGAIVLLNLLGTAYVEWRTYGTLSGKVRAEWIFLTVALSISAMPFSVLGLAFQVWLLGRLRAKGEAPTKQACAPIDRLNE